MSAVVVVDVSGCLLPFREIVWKFCVVIDFGDDAFVKAELVEMNKRHIVETRAISEVLEFDSVFRN